jgi:hypothetical protein
VSSLRLIVKDCRVRVPDRTQRVLTLKLSAPERLWLAAARFPMPYFEFLCKSCKKTHRLPGLRQQERRAAPVCFFGSYFEEPYANAVLQVTCSLPFPWPGM